MLTVTLVLFGLIGLAGLKVNLLPDLSYPTLTVRTDFEGAAPLEIENLISQPVEEAVGVVKNVRKVHSVSRTGQSDVVLEFAWGTDMDMASLEVRDKLDTLQLPLEAKKPLLLRFNPSTDPILRLGLSAAEAGATSEVRLKQLRRYADEDLKKRLEPVAGVAAVKVGGGLEDEIDVAIDQHKLARLGLDVNDVITRLRNENVNASGGRIEEGSQRFLVRTLNQFKSLDEMRELLVKVDGGVPIRLRDVAEVNQGHKEREGIVRIDGREAVELAIYKEGDANTVSVADAVKAELARQKDRLPADARLSTIEDQSVFIGHALREVKIDALIGGLLAILVIFFFLGDAWSTFIISLSLPVSLIATFFFMDQLHLSLNVMSLGGLALATGMVVDDSIVVLENIARLREKGASILDAAVRGTAEVGMAVTASTLTTVAVFFPLVFVQGVAGQLFRDQALTISFAMLVSLLVAMTLIPMLASLKGRAPLAYRDEAPAPPRPLPRNRVLRVFSRGGRAVGEGLFQILPRALGALVALFARTIGRALGRVLRFIGRGVTGPYDRAAAFYHRSLPKALEHPWRVLGFAAAALVASLALVPTLGLDLIPQLAQGRFDMTVTLPPGTPLADTDRLVEEIASRHAKDPGVASIYGVAGTGTRLDANPTESGENIARLSIALADGGSRAVEAAETERLRAGLHRPDASVKFARPALFSFSAPLEIEIRGYDLDALAQGGQRLAALMKASDRFADVKSTVEGGYPEIQVRFDQERAAALGLTTREIADRLVRKVKGEVATRYDFRDRKIDVLVRARQADRGSVDDIRGMIVGYVAASSVSTGGATASKDAKVSDTPQSAGDVPIRLGSVAEVIAGEGPSEIHRISQERVAIVSSNLRHGDLASAVAEVEHLVAQHPLAAGIKVHVGGQGEELADSVNSLLFALGLAIFLVYLVMASQFESLLHPFVIMFSIPLAAVGAVLALKLSGSAISVVVFIGLIMLVGIVVKNAIVLIDRVNQLRGEGVPKREALMQAAESRLRPIVMTTLCTLIGFSPLAIGVGEGAEVRAPMALTVIGGLAVSTLLTLVVVPVVYDLLDRRGDAWYVAAARRRTTKPATGSGDVVRDALA
ncbi:MAG: efflux RND transporter permease subunit [Xanthomonadales bacterium]|nr:efflux RND transporter permease subunit [Xanthomonadales bacterium]